MNAETEQRYIDNLLALKERHPSLSIVPKIDEDIVPDDGRSWWLGSWGDAQVGYMTSGTESEYLDPERIYFDADDTEIKERIEEGIRDQYPNLSDSGFETLFNEAWGAITWKAVIAVSIHLPAPWETQTTKAQNERGGLKNG